MATQSNHQKYAFVAAAALGVISGVLHLIGALDPPDGMFLNFDDFQIAGQLLLWGAPIATGVLAGRAWPEAPVWSGLKLGLVSIVCAAPLLFRGLLCLIYIVPVTMVVAPLIAKLVSLIVRARQKRSLPPIELLLLLAPLGPAADAWRTMADVAPVEISDSIVVSRPTMEIWTALDRVDFVPERPAPWWMRAFLPTPLGVTGSSMLGALRHVRFTNGVVQARVTEASPGRRLAFELSIEERGPEFFDHYAVLLNSEFVLEAISSDTTRVTHRTRYRPTSYPRWYFEPGERFLGSQVQGYLLQAFAEQHWRDTTLVRRD